MVHRPTVATGQTHTPHHSMTRIWCRQAAMVGYIAQTKLSSRTLICQGRDLTRAMTTSMSTPNPATRRQVGERRWVAAGAPHRACLRRESKSRGMIARGRTLRTPTDRSCNNGGVCLLHPHHPVDYYHHHLVNAQQAHHGCLLTRVSAQVLFPRGTAHLYEVNSVRQRSTLYTTGRIVAGVTHPPCQDNLNLSIGLAVQASLVLTTRFQNRSHHLYPLVHLGQGRTATTSEGVALVNLLATVQIIRRTAHRQSLPLAPVSHLSVP